MELPHIGEHCSEVACRQLDFLPFTCSLCKKIYCLQHHKVSAHDCTEARTVDVQVPVCPLCDQAVPAPRGQPPDIAISRHLDDNCKVKKKKIFTNKCCYTNCKKKEMMPIECRDCGLNFCLSHRHPNDHQCSKVRSKSSSAGAEHSAYPSQGSFLQSLRDQAAARFGPNPFNLNSRSPNTASTSAATARVQANMSEDEALARALVASEQQARVERMQETSTRNTTSSPADEDALLQEAIAASLREANGPPASSRRASHDCQLL
ncbi:Zinc finger AN1-type [Trinorchestia longiramus]|nr:Zinc finger AN1-type [Trinorchestia longiramus]